MLLSIELIMLVVLSVVGAGQGRQRQRTGRAPDRRASSWLNPFDVPNFSAFVSGVILMVFIYWGWDTAVSVNEETKDRTRDAGPGRDHLDA